MTHEFEWLRLRPQSSVTQPTRIPLSIYVLWHPRFLDGPRLARSVADWWNGASGDIRMAGFGIPVHFRSTNWTEDATLPGEPAPPTPSPTGDPVVDRAAGFDAWRRPVDLDDAEDNIFVPLVDDHMVNDLSWCRDLVDLARLHATSRGAAPVPRVHLAAFQLTTAWARLPQEVTSIKALYLDGWRDDRNESDAHRIRRRSERIRRLLTQAIVRLLREAGGPAQPLVTEVFLSHAKADREHGPGVAEHLRNVAAGYGQIEVFYDENDLPSGHDWRRRMLDSAASAAGFVAVVSDRYASRYWCRLEIQTARTPVRSKNRPDVWMVRPTVGVVTLADEWTRLIGDLATVPVIRWNRDDPEQAAAILDQLFREALLAEFHRRYAEMLCDKAAGLKQQLALITWTPDAASLSRLWRAATLDGARPTLVAYPGHGFLPTEESDLDDSLARDVAFLSFERLADRIVGEGPTPALRLTMAQRPVVALSVGDADNLAELGYDALDAGRSLHLDVAVLRLARAILEAPARIAYGGVLRDSPNFVSLLSDAVTALTPSGGPDRTLPSRAVADPPAPLINWIPRPRWRSYSERARAEMTGVCQYFVAGEDAPAGSGDGDPAFALAVARALSELRTRLATSSHLTLVIAGKRWRAAGFMPGLAEEVAVTVPDGDAARDPAAVSVVLLAEFGGVTRDIARYLLDPALSLPRTLRLDDQLADLDGPLATLVRAYPDLRAELEGRYHRMQDALGALRGIANLRDQSTELPRLGITVVEWRALLTTSSIGFVRRMLRTKVLPRVCERRLPRVARTLAP